MIRPPAYLAILLLFITLFAAGCDDSDDGDDSESVETAATPTSCPTTFSISKDALCFDLHSEICACGLARASILLAYEVDENRYIIRASDYPASEVSDNAESVVLSLRGHESAPDQRIAFSHDADEGFLRIDATLSLPETAEKPVRILHFEPIRLDADATLTLRGLSGRLHWLHNGYDSWAFTAVENISPTLAAQPRDGHILRPAGNNFDYMTDRLGMSWWVGAGRVSMGRAGFLAGALSAGILKTYMGVSVPGGRGDVVKFEMVMGTPGDSLTLDPGDSVSLDPAFFQFSAQLPKALEDYGRRAAQTIGALHWQGEEMRGWATWYELFEDVTVQDIRDHIDILVSEGFADAGYRVLQIDDGYEKAFGDWDENEKFADVSMDGLAAEIGDAGLIPGIWIAPFLVESDLPLIDEHPDWFLHDENGNIAWNADFVQLRKFAVLDATHPDAAEHLRSIIRRFVDAGYRYLKLDFLYPGAYEAVRYDSSLTALQAYSLACEIMREAAGEGVFLLASGEPLLPSAGHFHAARTSTDVISPPFTFTNFQIMGNIARANAARAWTASLFAPDPDNLCVREWMTLEKAQAALMSNILAGANVFLGDDLRRLDPERKAMLLDEKVIELMNMPAPMRPLDLFDETTDEFILSNYLDWFMQAGRTPVVWLRGNTLALINFRSRDVVKSIPVRDLGFSDGGGATLTDADNGETLHFENEIRLLVEAENVKLYRIENLPE